MELNWNVMPSLYTHLGGGGQGGQKGYGNVSAMADRSERTEMAKEKQWEAELNQNLLPGAAQEYAQTMFEIEMNKKALQNKQMQMLMGSDDMFATSNSPEFRKLVDAEYALQYAEMQTKSQLGISKSQKQKYDEMSAEDAGEYFMDSYGNMIGRDREGRFTLKQEDIVSPMTRADAYIHFGKTIGLGEQLPQGVNYDPNLYRNTLNILYEKAGKEEFPDKGSTDILNEALRYANPEALKAVAKITDQTQQKNAIQDLFLSSMDSEMYKSAKATFFNTRNTMPKYDYEYDKRTGDIVYNTYTQKDYESGVIDPVTNEKIDKTDVGRRKLKGSWETKDFMEWMRYTTTLAKQGTHTLEMSVINPQVDKTEEYQNFSDKVINRSIFKDADTVPVSVGGTFDERSYIKSDNIFEQFKVADTFDKLNLDISNFPDKERISSKVKRWYDYYKANPDKRTEADLTSYVKENLKYALMPGRIQQFLDAGLKSDDKDKNAMFALDRLFQVGASTFNVPFRKKIVKSTIEDLKLNGLLFTDVNGFDIVLPGNSYGSPQKALFKNGAEIVHVENILEGPDANLNPNSTEVYTQLYVLMSEDDFEDPNNKIRMKGKDGTPDWFKLSDNLDHPDITILRLDSEHHLAGTVRDRLKGHTKEEYTKIMDNIKNYYIVPLTVVGNSLWELGRYSMRPRMSKTE